MQPVRKAILPVAGFGTRFLPAAKALPKEMLPIVDTPQIQYLVEEVVASGIKEIIFVTGRGKHAIENHFDESFELEHVLALKRKSTLLKSIRRISRLARFAYVRQPSPLGHGDAVLRAAHLLAPNEPVAVIFGDDLIVGKEPALKQMLTAFQKYQDVIVALGRVPKSKLNLFGIVKAQKIEARTHQISGFVEKPGPKKAPSNLAVIGKYILTPAFLSVLRALKPPQPLQPLKPPRELGLGDAFLPFLKNHPVYGYEVVGEWYDVGSKAGFLKAQIEFGLRHPETKQELRAFLRKRVSK